MSESVQQFGRKCQVVTGTAGSGLDVEDLRIQFEITKTLLRTPNTATVKIFNLTQDHESQIKGEFDEMLVNAGYEGAVQLVFRGNIRYATTYRDGNDWITQIDAADGDKDFKQARMIVALGASSSAQDLLDHVVKSFEDTALGHVALPALKRIRGAVFAGPTREVLDKIAGAFGAHWSIQNGVLDIVPADSTLPTEAVVINADTGMLGAPERDDKGIKVRCLLNPKVVPNGKIWLNNNDIQIRERKQRDQAPGANKPSTKSKTKEIARLSPDGIYKVYKVVLKGDTRGNEWENEIRCIALGKPIPSGDVAA